jgi:CheY-like chemotaxis protein
MNKQVSGKNNKTILIVEDDFTSALYLMELIPIAHSYPGNITINHVEKGEDAVNYCKNSKVDLVLMDIRLKDISGLEATRLIKENNPHLPIITQTAYIHDESEIKAIEAGCDAWLAKPISFHDIEHKLKKYL